MTLAGVDVHDGDEGKRRKGERMVGREKRKQGQGQGKDHRGTGSCMGVACPASPLEALWQALTSALLSTYTRSLVCLCQLKSLWALKLQGKMDVGNLWPFDGNHGEGSVDFVIASSRTSG